MKNLALLLAILFTGTFGAHASDTAVEVSGSHHLNPAFGYGKSFVFVEDGITFAVYPDGEFDFYINDTPHGGPHVNISFNAGYNYSSYVQFDDYGAVIQVLNTPVFYDYYGRVAQIGSVRIYYNNRRVVRIGGLHVFYDPYGAYSHCNGYINVYNRVYVYRPFHRFFVRPVVQFCLVSFRPYRRYYTPARYTYYRPYVNNVRTCYATVGKTYYYKKNRTRRGIYKNDRRVSRVHYNTRSEKASRRGVAQAYTTASKRGYANTYQRSSTERNSRKNTYQRNDSRRSAANGYQRNNAQKSSASTYQRKGAERSRANTSARRSVSVKNYANARKRSENAAASAKRYKASGSKVLKRRSSSPEKASRKAQYRSKSSGSRSSKATGKSSDYKKRTVSKTRGRSRRSGT